MLIAIALASINFLEPARGLQVLLLRWNDRLFFPEALAKPFNFVEVFAGKGEVSKRLREAQFGNAEPFELGTVWATLLPAWIWITRRST